MSNFSFIELSNGTRFTVAEIPRTVALKSKPLNMCKVVRLVSANNTAIVGITAEGKLYSSALIQYARTHQPGSYEFTQWLTALYRLGLVKDEEFMNELAVHDKALADEQARDQMQRLKDYAADTGVELDWESYNAKCIELGIEVAPAFTPEQIAAARARAEVRAELLKEEGNEE